MKEKNREEVKGKKKEKGKKEKRKKIKGNRTFFLIYGITESPLNVRLVPYFFRV